LQRQNPFEAAVEGHPYDFDKPDELVRPLQGAEVLINTCRVRFDHRDLTHTQAVQNALRLFDAARRAGVPQVVNVSISNPSPESELPTSGARQSWSWRYESRFMTGEAALTNPEEASSRLGPSRPRSSFPNYPSTSSPRNPAIEVRILVYPLCIMGVRQTWEGE
jgi:hypothetical protein